MKKSISILTMLFLMLTLITGCKPKADNETLTETDSGYTASVIRINNSGSYGSAVLAIIQEKDLLSAYLPEGVTVEWTAVEGGPNIRDALIAEQVDVATFAGSTFISAYESGMPVVLISNGSDGPTKLFSTNPDIKTILDIPDDARISLTNKATNAHLAFMAACKEAFGDANKFDANLVPIANADALAAVAATNEFSCSLFTFPSDIKAAKIEGVHVVMDLGEVASQYGIGSYLVANKDYYEANPALIEALNKAYADAIDYMIANPADAAAILGEAYNIEPSFVQNLIETNPPRAEVTGYDKLTGLMLEAGILSKEPQKFEDLSNYDSIPKM